MGGLQCLACTPEHSAELRGRHTHEERRKPPYPCSVLNLVDPQLHGHVKAMQDVSAEYQRVYRGVDCMDPAWRGAGKTRSATGPTYARMQEGARGPVEHSGPGWEMLRAA